MCSVSVGAGIDFINRYGHDRISDHENALCSRFIAGLERLDGVRIYRRDRAKYLPIVLFNLDGILPEESTSLLSDRGFALRGGLHCSGLAHKAAGTLPNGAIRFSPSCFNTTVETDMLCRAIGEICSKR